MGDRQRQTIFHQHAHDGGMKELQISPSPKIEKLPPSSTSLNVEKGAAAAVPTTTPTRDSESREERDFMPQTASQIERAAMTPKMQTATTDSKTQKGCGGGAATTPMLPATSGKHIPMRKKEFGTSPSSSLRLQTT